MNRTVCRTAAVTGVLEGNLITAHLFEEHSPGSLGFHRYLNIQDIVLPVQAPNGTYEFAELARDGEVIEAFDVHDELTFTVHLVSGECYAVEEGTSDAAECGCE